MSIGILLVKLAFLKSFKLFIANNKKVMSLLSIYIVFLKLLLFVMIVVVDVRNFKSKLTKKNY